MARNWALTAHAALMFFAVLAAAQASESAAKPSVLRWARADDSLALMSGGEIVWRFNYGKNAGKPNFDPLAPVGLPSISWLSPPDHAWHYGLWFSWKFINGVNYWEIEKKTGRPQGTTCWKNVHCDARPDFSAHITLDVEYAPGDDAAPLLTERRGIDISAPAADGSYSLDWTAAFTVGAQDLVFDRTPPPGEKNGVAYGGYAGLSLRMRKLANVKAASAESAIEFNDEHRFRGKSSAFDYSGELSGAAVGVAMLDHPANIHAPSPWYAINDAQMCFFNAAALCFEPLRVKAAQSFTLRYRIVVHPGSYDAAKLVQLQKDFAQKNAH
ncbi:MAG TPA: DUF6807 family protein [Planctomycetota bacterium]|nr:DUF6807 family protein [Planctomycetota bacterium]